MSGRVREGERVMAQDERRLVELELLEMRQKAARTDKWQWRGLWIVTLAVFALLTWLVYY